jgi:hypothetical protein
VCGPTSSSTAADFCAIQRPYSGAQRLR